MKISKTEASKLREAACNTRLRLVTSNNLIEAAIMFVTPRWTMSTPFGCPVEPDV